MVNIITIAVIRNIATIIVIGNITTITVIGNIIILKYKVIKVAPG